MQMMSKISHGMLSMLFLPLFFSGFQLKLRIVGQIIGTIISSVVMLFLGTFFVDVEFGWGGGQSRCMLRASLMLQRLVKIHVHR